MSFSQIPTDVVKYILLFVPSKWIHILYGVNKKFNTICQNEQFLLKKLESEIKDIRANLIPELWKIPSNIFPKLSNHQKYVRTLAFYNIVVPGSYMWLNIDVCYKLATKANDLEMATYFNNKLNIPSDIQGDLGIVLRGGDFKSFKRYIKGEKVYYESDIRPKYMKIFTAYVDIYQGKMPENLEKIANSFYYGYSTIFLKIAIRYGHYNLATMIAEKCNITYDICEETLINEFIRKNDLAGLKSLNLEKINNFPGKLKSDIPLHGYITTFITRTIGSVFL